MSIKENGFTLIELILVIFIIAVLSTLAINGYTQYRRSALLNYAADDFVAEFYAMRDKTIHGNYGPDNEAKCFGFYFQHIDGALEVKKIEIPYEGKKEPTALNENGDFSWVFQTCKKDDLMQKINDFVPFEKDASVNFIEVYDGGNETPLNDFGILFAPPEGKIETVDVFSGGQYQNLTNVKMVIKYGQSEKAQFKKNININLDSGKISVTNFEDV